MHRGSTHCSSIHLNRRAFACGAILFAAGMAGRNHAMAQLPSSAVSPEARIRNGRIRQSVMAWCFEPMSPLDLARHCLNIGITAIEGVDPKYYPELRRLGMQISLVPSHGFQRGPFQRENHDYCIAKLREGIDLAVQYGAPGVITFTGMRSAGISDEQGARNCVDCWKQVIGYAEEKGINLCLEHLNTRDSTHPMKGHPGYFGDNLELVVDLIRRVDSPRMKLLFDIYHVQIMHGDVIRRIRQYHPYIAHYHTAGVPGRGELDDRQELNYPAIMRAILETGYQGYVAQEFIPTWSDPIQALRHAAMVCDV
jgi:hydroxypyruvate isomerase